MDYSKIKLENERNSHVTKRLNRLSTWGFFKVLYRDNMWRMFGYSLLMLLCIAPIVAMQFVSGVELSRHLVTLPNLNSWGFATGTWQGLAEYSAQYAAHHNMIFGLYTVASALLVFVVLSGGFAVIRDGFWTGKLSTVGVFKSIGMGISASFGYALASAAIGAFGVFGVAMFYVWAASVMDLWLAIVLTVLLCVALFLVVMYLFILCSVAVTYKQSLRQNLDDSWRLLWLNFLPNTIHLVLALLPIGLVFLFQGGGFLYTLFLVIIFMFGGLYIPLVWHTFMMKTFALFHPVEAKKKKDFVREENERIMQQAQARIAAEDAAAARKAAKKAAKNKKAEKAEEVETSADPESAAVEEASVEDVPVEEASGEGDDVYATEKDAYAVEEE